ncbi:MAG: GDP-mannose 4,6-dehydratase [Pseudomonadota bacterium]
MHILVTGASGFVGSHLVPHLNRTFTEALVTGIGGPPDRGGVDIADYESVATTIRRHKPDIIIHLAALSAVSESLLAPEAAYRINLGGTLNILRAISEESPLSALIFASTSEVYGRSFRSGEALDETAQLAPMNPYAVSKAAADLAVQEAANRKVRATILRLFNHIGPGQSTAFALPSFARQIAEIELRKKPPILLTGNLSAYRDFLDISDVLNAYTSVVENIHQLNQCEIFNISSGVPRKISDLLNYLLSLSNVEIKIDTDPNRLRPSDIQQAIGNATQAEDRLGWQPERPVEYTLKSILEHERIEARKLS